MAKQLTQESDAENRIPKRIREMQDVERNSLKRWKAKGRKVSTYTCPLCAGINEVRRPLLGEVNSRGCWDSVRMCFHCLGATYVAVYPSGRTEIGGSIACDYAREED